MEDPYVYPGTDVLRNKLEVRTAAELDRIERLLVTQRMIEGAPDGQFDLPHLCSIHRHLFQDLYVWAGEVRMVELSKGGQAFLSRGRIATEMADIHRRLLAAGFLAGLDRTAFAQEAGRIIGDLNFVHPFREGNGRTQLLYARQLAARAGYTLVLTRLHAPDVDWIAASREAHEGRYDLMARCIELALAVQP